MLILLLLTVTGILSVLLMIRSIVIIDSGYRGWGYTTMGFGLFSFLATVVLSNVMSS